jgi:HD-GYP domain-containing protein (c-di-GMP phosphodiesterase class II)
MSDSATGDSSKTASAGQVNYCKVPIKYILQFPNDFHLAELFIRLGNEKYVKLTLREAGFVDTLKAYQQKGLGEIYLTEVDFKTIFTSIKNRVTHKQFYDPETIDENRMSNLELTFKMAKEFIANFGVDQDVMDVLKGVNVQSLRVLKQSPNIFAFFKDFRKNCSDEFLKNVMINHLVMLIIDKFSWKSTAIKEKATIASLLCDVTMTKEDFDVMKKCDKDGEPYPERIKHHPIRVAEVLREKKEMVSMETLTIIEQHHEKPDGTGFPYGHNHHRINQLSAIYITATMFMEMLIKSEFNYQLKNDLLDDLYTEMSGGAFDKAFEALRKVVTED